MKTIDLAGRIVNYTAQSGLEFGMFGDGTDGVLTFDGSAVNISGYGQQSPTGGGASSSDPYIYTLPRSIFCTAMTVGLAAKYVTVKTAGYKVFCLSTLTLLSNGILSNAGNDGVNATAGPALAASDLGGSWVGGAGGAAGVIGGNGANATTSMGGAGGAGGTGSVGVGPGIAGVITTRSSMRSVGHHLLAGATLITGGAGGSGGGGGNGASGGGGGGGGGVLMVFAANIVNNGLIAVDGGKGGNGGNGTTGGGGGGGGGGGLLYLVYNSSSGSGQNTSGPGPKGLKGTGGASPSDGVTGSQGVVMKFNGATRAWEP